MTRDLILLRLIAADAQLRFIEGVSEKIGDATMHRARIPPMITSVRRDLERLRSQVEQLEGMH